MVMKQIGLNRTDSESLDVYIAFLGAYNDIRLLKIILSVSFYIREQYYHFSIQTVKDLEFLIFGSCRDKSYLMVCKTTEAQYKCTSSGRAQWRPRGADPFRTLPLSLLGRSSLRGTGDPDSGTRPAIGTGRSAILLGSISRFAGDRAKQPWQASCYQAGVQHIYRLHTYVRTYN